MSLTEDTFISFLSHGGDAAKAVFGEGSLFSPFLFGKFFDPADAFPLWDFDSDALLSGLRNAKKTSVNWAETDSEYALRADLPGTPYVALKINSKNHVFYLQIAVGMEDIQNTSPEFCCP